MLLSKLSQLLPCLLCKQAHAEHASVCLACWDSLPWQKQMIQRHELSCFIACHYAFPLQHILHEFKDHAKLEYSKLLTACLLTMPKPKVQAIVPMPLATEKLLQRGFNQSLILAKQLAKAWQIPVWQPISRLHSPSQRGMNREERLQNVQTLFYPNTTQCRYKHVLILDDVITTGASLMALKHNLIELGCTHIHALCLCDAAD